MDNVKSNEYYLSKIVVDVEFILKHTANIDKGVLKNNQVLLDSVMFRLIQISENSNKLTDSFKARYDKIPWHAIKGLRNRIVHEYGDVDVSIIYDTITEDLPILLTELKALLK